MLTIHPLLLGIALGLAAYAIYEDLREQWRNK